MVPCEELLMEEVYYAIDHSCRCCIDHEINPVNVGVNSVSPEPVQRNAVPDVSPSAFRRETTQNQTPVFHSGSVGPSVPPVPVNESNMYPPSLPNVEPASSQPTRRKMRPPSHSALFPTSQTPLAPRPSDIRHHYQDEIRPDLVPPPFDECVEQQQANTPPSSSRPLHQPSVQAPMVIDIPPTPQQPLSSNQNQEPLNTMPNPSNSRPTLPPVDEESEQQLQHEARDDEGQDVNWNHMDFSNLTDEDLAQLEKYLATQNQEDENANQEPTQQYTKPPASQQSGFK